jgi:hypothetical protein
MSWETRNGRGRYYTRSRRISGQIVRKYFGSGASADLMASLDQCERERRATEAAQKAARRADDAAVDAQLDKICRLADLVSRAVLLAAGFHHHHGQWRKRREKARETKIACE